MFVVGTLWFAAASLLCGAAPNVDVLIAARVLQGVGAALLTPGSLAILQASFRENDRAAAVGAWSGLGGVAGAIGPFVGGWLVDGPGWRWAFLINVPVAALVVVCARAAVPESRDPHAARGLDLIGAALAVVSLGAATWSLTEAGPRGWTNPAVVGAGVVAAVGIGGVRPADAPHARSARAALALSQPGVHGDQSRDRAPVQRVGCDVLPRRLPTPGCGGLVGTARRHRADAGDTAHARVLVAIGRARAADRSAAPAHGRPAARRRLVCSCSRASARTRRGPVTCCPAQSCSGSDS